MNLDAHVGVDSHTDTDGHAPHLWMPQVEKWKAARDKKERLHTAYNKIAMKDRLWPAVKEVLFLL
jgi:hypothetical protein